MLSKEQNELLTSVGPGTAMGNLMRRYWLPALLSEELPAPDSDPKALRLLGEDLVAFRDSGGRVGVLELYCPHRQTSLALGRNEESGLRCIYHGWKIAIDGTVLDTPCEPPESRLKDKVRHRSYPAREAGGIVWVYMGPAAEVPPFCDFVCLDDAKNGQGPGRRPRKMWEECNWAQALEGAIDSFHSAILHSGFEILHWTPEQIARVYNRPSRALYGSIECEDTSYGLRYAATRTPTADPELYDYVRVTEFVFPCFFLTPPDLGFSGGLGAFVPVDDHNSLLYSVSVSGESSVVQYRRARAGDVPVDENYRPLRNRRNNYLQDREMMRRKETSTSFSGIDTSPAAQDLAVVETMGSVSDRTREHLGLSDLAIIRWRERALRAAQDVAAGEPAPGREPPAPYSQIRAGAGMIPKGSGEWRSFTWDHEAPQAEPHIVR